MNVRKPSATCSRLFSLFLSALALSSLCTGTQQSYADAANVTAQDWASVRSAYEDKRHAAVPAENGFEARNPGQGWQLQFDERGLLVEPESGTWNWGLELVSYGFAGSERVVGDTACVSADGGRVTYEWDDTCEEWFINDTRGVEHGFTIRERPGTSERGALQLKLRIRGGHEPVVSNDRLSVRFRSESEATELNYSGLTVFDATGEKLRAWFSRTKEGLTLSVDECGAHYPLTIDPVVQQAYLTASNFDLGDGFGTDVALSGNTLVVGARYESSSASGVDGDQNDNGTLWTGAAYVFVRSGTTWTQQAYLKASNPGAQDYFGISVDVSGDTIVVGASNEDSSSTGVDGDQSNNGAVDAGAAYVFVRNGTTWTQQAYLKSSNPGGGSLPGTQGDWFGLSVVISGDTIVASARNEDSSSTGVNGDQSNESSQDAGAAYVFVRSGSTWSQQAYLKASNTDDGTGPFDGSDGFGQTLAISGETIIVGSQGEDSDATGVDGDQSNSNERNSGAAYVFVRTGTTWSQQAFVKSSNSEGSAGAPGSLFGDLFGGSIAIDGDTMIVGAANEDSGALTDQNDNSADQAGAAYVFIRTGTTWSQQAYLKSSNTGASDQFGVKVAIAGDKAVIGAWREDSNARGINGDQSDNSSLDSGAAYVFERAGTVWTQSDYLKASDSSPTYRFPRALDMDGETVLAGNLWIGAAYVFDLDFDQALPPIGTDFCNGDGGDQMGCTNCPCMNNAPSGTIGGCLNSDGTATRLIAEGDPSVSLPTGSTSDLRFSLTNAPYTAFVTLNSGDAVGPGNPVNPCFGSGSGTQAVVFDGLRCAIINTRRHGGRSVDITGQVGITNSPWGGEGNPLAGIAQAGGSFVAGQTRYFQAIHRDDPLAVCMRGLNTSQAVRITFTP